ncbi:MAG TPA: hypothetical protein VMX75_05845 [Spirochaetia bacterium]|nr:hypothetical protein [Spirochaetia bacterium]
MKRPLDERVREKRGQDRYASFGGQTIVKFIGARISDSVHAREGVSVFFSVFSLLL